MNFKVEYEKFLSKNLPIISSNNIPLGKIHIDAFYFLLAKKTIFKFQKIRLWKNPECITAVQKDWDYIQIISLSEHYI